MRLHRTAGGRTSPLLPLLPHPPSGYLPGCGAPPAPHQISGPGRRRWRLPEARPAPRSSGRPDPGRGSPGRRRGRRRRRGEAAWGRAGPGGPGRRRRRRWGGLRRRRRKRGRGGEPEAPTPATKKQEVRISASDCRAPIRIQHHFNQILMTVRCLVTVNQI